MTMFKRLITLISTRGKTSKEVVRELNDSYQHLEKVHEAKVTRLQVKEPFIGFIIGERNHAFEAYLVNPTDKHYWRVVSLTGAFAGDEEGLLETSKAMRDRGSLPEQFAIPIEIDDDIGGLDFKIWYQLDLFERDKEKPEMVAFSLPKYGLGYKPKHLPILNRQGMYIPLEKRDDHELIEARVKHINMRGGYYKTEK